MLDKIKRLTLKSLMNDERLMYGLVLKGGNALQLVYEMTDRASMDIDFSIAGDFSELDYIRIGGTLDVLLNEEFNKEGLRVFDVHFIEKPKSNTDKFWKGYQIDFKVTPEDKFYVENIDKTRREAIKMAGDSTKFSVDISSFEYVEGAKKHEIDGTVLRVYTPAMIVLEKIRALCQSVPEYKAIVASATVKGRARDFYDIWNICQHYSIDFTTAENLQMLKDIFEAKRVPLSFLEYISLYKDLQRENWSSVEATLSDLNKGFDFYFDFTMSIVEKIKTL